MDKQYGTERDILSKIYVSQNKDLAEQPASRTSIKNQMQKLQQIGIKLTQLKLDKLKNMHLPDRLFEAIKATNAINSNGALRRQYQYIGKLMRELDDQDIILICKHLIEKGI